MLLNRWGDLTTIRWSSPQKDPGYSCKWTFATGVGKYGYLTELALCHHWGGEVFIVWQQLREPCLSCSRHKALETQHETSCKSPDASTNVPPDVRGIFTVTNFISFCVSRPFLVFVGRTVLREIPSFIHLSSKTQRKSKPLSPKSQPKPTMVNKGNSPQMAQWPKKFYHQIQPDMTWPILGGIKQAEWFAIFCVLFGSEL